VNYLLDTHACIALINGNRPSVRASFGRRQTSVARYLCRPSLCSNSGTVSRRVRVEILTRSASRPSLQALSSRCLLRITIRPDLESIGKSIGAYDLLIAGQAIRNKLTLITANLSEFARIKGLFGQTGAAARAHAACLNGRRIFQWKSLVLWFRNAWAGSTPRSAVLQLIG